MKFAKELEEDLVPEWRVKYFDYKASPLLMRFHQGKKKIKAVSRAYRNTRSPWTAHRQRTPRQSFTVNDLLTNTGLRQKASAVKQTVQGAGGKGGDSGSRDVKPDEGQEEGATAGPIPIPMPSAAIASGDAAGQGEDELLVQSEGANWTKYGSILGSPPTSLKLSRPVTLNLPDPAMDPESDDSLLAADQKPAVAHHKRIRFPHLHASQASKQSQESAFEVGKTRHPPSMPHLPRHRHSHTGAIRDRHERPLMKRLFSAGGKKSTTPRGLPSDVPLEALKELDEKQTEFWTFLESELNKIEKFYKEKEEESTSRLNTLKEQLHILRDQRIDQAHRVQEQRKQKKKEKHKHKQNGETHQHHQSLTSGLNILQYPLRQAKVSFTKTPDKPTLLMTPPQQTLEHRKDYVRRPEVADIPYKDAKKRLKTALQEFYRGLELLKSYALLNRTAFRKINKKYDKTVQARPSMLFMNEKVSDSYFVKSTIIDGHITTVEDLYARYFEKGNHKVAMGKLRQKSHKLGDYTGSSFRNGVLLAAGFVLAVEAVVKSGEHLFTDEPAHAEQVSYLLQIYGGYFLLLFLMLFFCLDCRIFSLAKVNFVFVFEFDTRHNLDWRQMFEIPSLLFFLMGLIMFLNFYVFPGRASFLYWPIVLVGLTLVVLFYPLPFLYHESRKWFLVSLGRLFISPFPAVEFRDFFLGDMLCSQTYALSNIALFFCLYSIEWNNPPRCNSSHSHLLGFFQTVPGIIRLLQCLRRYRDTRKTFPHLVNGGKYTCTILYYMFLSLWRIHETDRAYAEFITFAAINALYCTVWDLVMDWSLLDPYARHRFLRNELGYKQIWFYYVSIVIDPILRNNWILYVIFANDSQHSAFVSFGVALSEAFRRGIWTLLRVENEHCTNVQLYRASRDVPLPYKSPDEASLDYERHAHDPSNEDAAANDDERAPAPGSGSGSGSAHQRPTPSSFVSGSRLECAQSRETAASSLRRRQTQAAGTPSTGAGPPTPSARSRVANILHTAHAQDFERRRPGAPTQTRDSDDDDDDDEDEDDADEYDAYDDDDGHAQDGESEEDESERRERAQRADDRATRRNREDVRDVHRFLHTEGSDENV